MGGAAANTDGNVMNDEDLEGRAHLDSGKMISRLRKYHSMDDNAIWKTLRSSISKRKCDKYNTTTCCAHNKHATACAHSKFFKNILMKCKIKHRYRRARWQ